MYAVLSVVFYLHDIAIHWYITGMGPNPNPDSDSADSNPI